MKHKQINTTKIMVNSKTKQGKMLKAMHENDSITSWRKFEKPVWFTMKVDSISTHNIPWIFWGQLSPVGSASQCLSAFSIPGNTTCLPYQQVRVRTKLHTKRRKWQPTPVFLPGESHGRRSLVGYSPWSCKESGHDWVTSLSQKKKKKIRL